MLPTSINLTTRNGIVLIRPANQADVPLFSDLRLEALRDNPTAFGSSYEDMQHAIQEWSLKVLQTNPQDGCNFVAQFGHDLLGMAAIRRESGRKRWHAATIGGVFIRPAWRGLGIVDKLLESCAEWAKNQGIVVVKLAVVTTNQAALNAYQRNGFKIYGTDPMVLQHEGVYYDDYLLARQLA